MGYLEKQKGYFYRVERVDGKKTRQKLSGHEAWAAEYQKDYDPNWCENTPLESDVRTGCAVNPSLPCVKSTGICPLRTIPGAPFDCVFTADDCPFLIRKGD